MSNSDWRAVLGPMLASAGLTSPLQAIEPLTGGVSSDIVLVELADGRMLCAKRALAKLKVASDWSAPVERNRYEVAWLRLAGTIVPNAVPAVVAESEADGVVVMEYLPAADFVLWKAELLGGQVDPQVAQAVGATLGAIHAATWDNAEVAAAFRTDHLIDALRLDPYLRFTASRHPAVAGSILAVLERTATTKQALVHGDVSPKNILVRRSNRAPVLLDAECAWYGDPAFDAAFCINHLLLKAYHLPHLRGALGAAAAGLLSAWLDAFPAAQRAALEYRTATLLPCLLLARIDGKSPVEYLDEPTRSVVRQHALDLLAGQAASLAEVTERSIERAAT